MLEIDGAVVRYGAFLAVDAVSLSIAPGEIVGLIGPNGAGKSSLVRSINGLVRPTGGHVRFQGKPLDRVPARDRVSLGLATVPEGRGLFTQMSVDENLAMGGYPVGDRQRTKTNAERAFELFPILKERRHQRAGTMSGGQQQMLAIAMGLMSNPTLLMIDEPSLGLAPIVIGDIGRTLKRFKAEGLTVLLVEQNARLTCDVADRIYVMQSGRILFHDTPEALLRMPEVVESFLSVS
jgi:branched-chain amino acid transport system ATP-binding protein